MLSLSYTGFRSSATCLLTTTILRCEVPRVPAAEDADAATFTPEVLYNLFATVNHTGNLTSGHYMTNVKVGGTWYHCNDAHVSKAGIDDGEVEVLKMDGTYLLFYMRS